MENEKQKKIRKEILNEKEKENFTNFANFNFQNCCENTNKKRGRRSSIEGLFTFDVDNFFQNPKKIFDENENFDNENIDTDYNYYHMSNSSPENYRKNEGNLNLKVIFF